MACEIERPNPQDLFDKYKNLFQNTVLGGAQIIEESNEWYAVSVNYAMAEEFFAIAEQAWKERDPRQACCDNLIAMAADEGFYPLPATPAQGYLKLTGEPGTVLPTPLEFTVGTAQFVTAYDEFQPTAVPAGGQVVIRVRAVNSGASGNLQEETGTLDTTVPGVESEVEVCGGSFCNGTDAEDCEAFRQRYLRRLQHTPRATDTWIKDKFLEWPCATRVISRGGSCCLCGCHDGGIGGAQADFSDCGCADCGGRLHYYVMFDGSFDNGIAPDTVLEEIEQWMFGSPQGYGLGQVPVGICGRVIPVHGVPTNVTVNLTTCPRQSQLAEVESLVQEFFTTVEPSKPVEARQLELSIERALGGDINANVELELVDTNDGYGSIDCGDGCDGHVHVSLCGLEPDCDYLITLNEINVTINDAASIGGCPS